MDDWENWDDDAAEDAGADVDDFEDEEAMAAKLEAEEELRKAEEAKKAAEAAKKKPKRKKKNMKAFLKAKENALAQQEDARAAGVAAVAARTAGASKEAIALAKKIEQMNIEKADGAAQAADLFGADTSEDLADRLKLVLSVFSFQTSGDYDKLATALKEKIEDGGENTAVRWGIAGVWAGWDIGGRVSSCGRGALEAECRRVVAVTCCAKVCHAVMYCALLCSALLCSGRHRARCGRASTMLSYLVVGRLLPSTVPPSPNSSRSLPLPPLLQHATQFLKDMIRAVGPMLSSVQLTEVGKTLNTTKNEKLKAEKGKTKKKKNVKPSMSRAMFDDDYDNDYGEYDYGDDDFM